MQPIDSLTIGKVFSLHHCDGLFCPPRRFFFALDDFVLTDTGARVFAVRCDEDGNVFDWAEPTMVDIEGHTLTIV